MESTKQNYTFQELLNMSLGSRKVPLYNMGILHSLIQVLLAKLNCQNEIVKINGFEATKLLKLLKESQESPYKWPIYKAQCLNSKFEKLRELEQRTENLNNKFEAHFKTGRAYQQSIDRLFSGDKWDFFTENTEDICSVPGRRNHDIHKIITSGHFNLKLRDIITQPLLQRMLEFETRIDDMVQQLNDLVTKSEKIFKTPNFIEPLVVKIENTRQEIQNHQKEFNEAMEEFQKMIDAKVDRTAYPALKTYLKHHFEITFEILKNLKLDSRKCPTTKPLTVRKGICLSCGVGKISQENVNTKIVPEDCRPQMSLCSFQPEINLQTRMKHISSQKNSPRKLSSKTLHYNISQP